MMKGKQNSQRYQSRREFLKQSLYTGLNASLVGSLLLSSCGKKQTARKATNIILISIDTLCASHLGCYGYKRPTNGYQNTMVNLFSYSSTITMFIAIIILCHGMRSNLSDPTRELLTVPRVNCCSFAKICFLWMMMTPNILSICTMQVFGKWTMEWQGYLHSLKKRTCLTTP